MLLPLKAIISKKVRKDGKAVIYFQYCYSSTNRVLLRTEIAIPISFWNAKRQCISKLLPQEFGDPEQLNGEIDRMKKIIETLIEHGRSAGETNLGTYVSGLFKPDFKIESLSRNPVIIPLKKKEADFFGEMESYTQSKMKKVCESGKGNYRMMRNHLEAFQVFRKQPISFSSLDYTFYVELVEFLSYDYKLKRKLGAEFGLKQATIGKTVKQLRMFIKDRVRRKIIQPIDMTDFKILDEETDAVYLSYEEIGRIYNLELKDKTLALYRDMFVLGCLTGLRFSDYSSLSWTDYRNGLLFKKTNKLDNWTIIPLRQEAAEIFNRHFSDAKPTVSNPVFNKYIKEIAEKAGITQSITFSHKKGNKDIVETKPKAQWITSHTCRRSFCTNEYLAGTDVSLIMKISGHKTHKEFFKYIRVTQEEAARQIEEIWNARNSMRTFSLSEVD